MKRPEPNSPNSANNIPITEFMADSPNKNAFLSLGNDVHCLVLEQTETVSDCVNLASCCFTLWSENQRAVFKRVLLEAHNHKGIDGLGYLGDMLESNPNLKREGINYRHLATILTRARTLLTTIIQMDPYCAWKIAAICGMKKTVKALLGSEISTKIDPYGRNVLAYYALGGQLDCMKELIEEHPELLPLDNTTLSTLARMAAFGGHIPVLKYLKEEHGFQLNHKFPPTSEEGLPETLLTAAVSGGDIPTVMFLKEDEHGIDPNVGVNLASIASDNGHFKLYDLLVEENNPIQDQDDAIVIAQDAARYGNATRVISLVKDYKIPPHHLILDILIGGNPKLFWHALNNNWFSLDATFENGATVQHILAREGHLELLKAVLKDTRALKAEHPNATKENQVHAAYVVDEHNQTLIHYAASGGKTEVYDYLRPYFTDLPVDNYGSSVAHVAAAAGAVWLLKKLFKSKDSNQVILAQDDQGASILHDAANCGEPNFLVMMIDEFHLDPKSKDNYGRTPLHILANLAENNIWMWDSIKYLLSRYPDEKLDSIPDGMGKTVRAIFEEWKASEDITGELIDSNIDQQIDVDRNHVENASLK